MRSEYYRKTEDVLYDYPYLKIKIDINKKKLEQYEPSVRSTDTTSPPASNSNITDTTFDQASKFNIYADHIRVLISETKAEITTIETFLDMLDPVEHRLLELRYFNGSGNSGQKDYQVISELNIPQATYYRTKNYLIDRLSVLLWGHHINEDDTSALKK
ncbi:MAG: hypothetical protein ACC608_09525 [Anaerofustis sp.]